MQTDVPFNRADRSSDKRPDFRRTNRPDGKSPRSASESCVHYKTEYRSSVELLLRLLGVVAVQRRSCNSQLKPSLPFSLISSLSLARSHARCLPACLTGWLADWSVGRWLAALSKFDPDSPQLATSHISRFCARFSSAFVRSFIRFTGRSYFGCLTALELLLSKGTILSS